MIPKYRAYSDKYGMREVVGLYWFDDHLQVSLANGVSTPIRSSDEVVDVMQATGLKNYFDEEVFDSDILFDEHKENFGVVYYDDEFGEWRVVAETNCESLYDWLDCPIRGNVYENKELLGGLQDE